MLITPGRDAAAAAVPVVVGRISIGSGGTGSSAVRSSRRWRLLPFCWNDVSSPAQSKEEEALHRLPPLLSSLLLVVEGGAKS